MTERRIYRAGWLLILAGLALYLFTLDAGLMPEELVGGDLITHHYAQVQARPANAPGYPLYTLGGWLWYHGLNSLLGWLGQSHPNPIPLLSSYSTLWALFSLWLFYHICLRLSRSPRWPLGHWPLAWLLSAFFGVTYFFWYYATTSEQYSSAVAQTLATLYLYLLWRAEVRTADQPTRREVRLLLGMAFLSGLSLAHMVTVAMMVPPLVAVILWERPVYLRQARTVMAAVAAALLPLLSYVYVYVRGGSHPEWWGEGDWADRNEWFWYFVGTAQGQEELSWGLEPGRPFFTDIFPSLIWQELSIPLLILGTLGIGLLSRRLAWMLWGTLLLYAVLCWVDRFGNWYQIILPAYPLALLGVMPLGTRLEAWLEKRSNLLAWLPTALMIGFVLWRVDASWPEANSRYRAEDTGLLRPVLLLDQPLPPNSLLFAEKADALGLDYLTQIWRLGGGSQVVSSPQAEAWLKRGEAVLTPWSAAPLLLAEVTVDEPLRLQSVSPDWVSVRPASRPAPATPQTLLGLDMGDGIRLLGYSVQPAARGEPVLRPDQQPPTGLDLLLFWQVSAPGPSGEWSISVRPFHGDQPVTDPSGAGVQNDSPGPVHGLRAFSAIPAGETVADGYRLPTYGQPVDTLLVILYRATEDGFENLAEVRLPLE
jgi:hypothetical protein